MLLVNIFGLCVERCYITQFSALSFIFNSISHSLHVTFLIPFSSRDLGQSLCCNKYRSSLSLEFRIFFFLIIQYRGTLPNHIECFKIENTLNKKKTSNYNEHYKLTNRKQISTTSCKVLFFSVWDGVGRAADCAGVMQVWQVIKARVEVGVPKITAFNGDIFSWACIRRGWGEGRVGGGRGVCYREGWYRQDLSSANPSRIL